MMESSPGGVVVTDKLGHKGPAGFRGGRSQPPLLTPNSLEFNPIENVFAKLKALLRKTAEQTVEALKVRIGVPLDAFAPAGSTSCFRTLRTDRSKLNCSQPQTADLEMACTGEAF